MVVEVDCHEELSDVAGILRRLADEFDRTQGVPLSTLLPSEMLSRYGRHGILWLDSFETLARSGGFLRPNERFTKGNFSRILENGKWDAWVRRQTKFRNWKSLVRRAVEELAARMILKRVLDKDAFYRDTQWLKVPWYEW